MVAISPSHPVGIMEGKKQSYLQIPIPQSRHCVPKSLMGDCGKYWDHGGPLFLEQPFGIYHLQLMEFEGG